jgi:MoaA/NifB/PqqE/SkfB family radical SAM enzyme
MRIIPNIPVVYKSTFPKDFINDVNGWGSYSKRILQDNIGKLLSLDIDFGNACSLNCPHCFRRNNKVDSAEKKRAPMNYANIIEIVRQGKELGLRSVKFLGAGEPFEDERFLEFLRDLKALNIVPSIFTKGHVIGDDNLVQKYYSRYGISTGKELVEELDKVDASILLGFNSFDTEIQDKMVGGIRGYTIKRNRALELLVEAGFNKKNPTHLCLAVNPVTNENYADVFEIYRWARVRNLYVIVCPTMISGRCGQKRAWRKITPTGKEFIELYTEIYRFNIEKGIQTLEQIKEEGVSSYAGGHPCNQIACGMYLTLTGTVLRCPGDDTTVLGSVWKDGHVEKESLKDIWLKSENYGRSGTFNCGCPPKWGKSIPYNLFTEVVIKLEKIQNQEMREQHKCS